MSEQESDKLKELGIISPQQSVAKAIDHLTSKDRIKMMSAIKDRKMVQKFALMYDVGEALGWAWMTESANNMLQLLVSCDKGLGRRQVVDVVKQPSEKMGLGGQLKEKIGSFIKSEG
jgi:hypothetical protein